MNDFIEAIDDKAELMSAYLNIKNILREKLKNAEQWNKELLQSNPQIGKEEIAKELVNAFITNKNVEPLNIGLYGDWGSGKTQIIHLIKNKLVEKQNPIDDIFKLKYLLNALKHQLIMINLDLEIK